MVEITDTARDRGVRSMWNVLWDGEEYLAAIMKDNKILWSDHPPEGIALFAHKILTPDVFTKA
jgi:hypothetical protein